MCFTNIHTPTVLLLNFTPIICSHLLYIKIPGRKAKSRLGITLGEETENKEDNKAGSARGLAGLLRVVDLGGGGGHHADHVPGDLPYARTRLGQKLTQSATFQRALTLDSAKVNWMLPTLLPLAPSCPLLHPTRIHSYHPQSHPVTSCVNLQIEVQYLICLGPMFLSIFRVAVLKTTKRAYNMVESYGLHISILEMIKV